MNLLTRIKNLWRLSGLAPSPAAKEAQRILSVFTKEMAQVIELPEEIDLND